MNGDGIDDMIFDAPGNDQDGTGAGRAAEGVIKVMGLHNFAGRDFIL